MTRKNVLLAATAVAALSLGISTTGALAFDVMDWEWYKTVNETVDINIDLTTDIAPEGLVQVEKLQMNFGDVNATSIVTDIQNNPPGENSGGPITVEGNIGGNIEWSPGPSGTPEDNPIDTGTYSSMNPNIVVSALPGGNADEGDGVDGNDAEFFFNISVTVDPEVLVNAQDAADLPKIENSATAVGNNQAVTSDVPLYLHDAQISAGSVNALDPDGTSPFAFALGAIATTMVDQDLQGVNAFYDIAALTVLGAATGFIEPADISATAIVGGCENGCGTTSGILNAYVENSATAVANNASWEISSANMSNHVVIADMTQLAIGNTTAFANVSNVSLNSYAGLGAAGFGGTGGVTPIVSNVATAVGNNVNITVGAPTP